MINTRILLNNDTYILRYNLRVLLKVAKTFLSVFYLRCWHGRSCVTYMIGDVQIAARKTDTIPAHLIHQVFTKDNDFLCTVLNSAMKTVVNSWLPEKYEIISKSNVTQHRAIASRCCLSQQKLHLRLPIYSFNSCSLNSWCALFRAWTNRMKTLAPQAIYILIRGQQKM